MGESTMPLIFVGVTVLIIGGAIFLATAFNRTDFGPMQFYMVLGVLAFIAMLAAVFKVLTK